MPRIASLLLLFAVVPSLTPAATLTVTNTNNGGAGSLRRAIRDANASPGADLITFAAGLSGKAIKPTAALDALTDEQTTIDGDLNDDTAPDVALDGSRLATGSGLLVQADQCIIEGLAIVRFPYRGVDVDNANQCTIRSCHLGVNLAGTAPAVNGYAEVRLNIAKSCVVGGTGTPNIISGGTGSWSGSQGITISGGHEHTIQGNYFGLNRAGTAKLGTDGTGISIYTSPAAAQTNAVIDNVFAGLYYGVLVSDSGANVIQGNLFGLAANGTTGLPIIGDCVRLMGACTDNQIGGTTAAARNVLVGTDSANGIEIGGSGNQGNRVQGNYFGLSAAGTARKSLYTGVWLNNSAGDQLIGGDTAAAGNYFASSNANTTYGVYCYYAGAGSTIRNNTFGLLAGGGAATRVNGTQIRLTQTSGVLVRENVIANAPLGINIDDSGATQVIGVYGNNFRACGYAAQVLGGAQAKFGNLANASTDDDGGNIFEPSNSWFFYNGTASRVVAEGNSFGTTVQADIDAKIYDKLDDPSKGRVDFIPLAGGVIPTGSSGAPLVALTGASAHPTGHGAEVLFTLSAPADVTVTILNVAGRPVASLPPAVAQAGLQRRAWNGCSAAGLACPGGAYLVRITACVIGGGQSTCLVPLTLRR